MATKRSTKHSTRHLSHDYSMPIMADMPYEFASQVGTILYNDINLMLVGTSEHEHEFSFVVTHNSKRNNGWDLSVESSLPLTVMVGGRCWGEFIKGWALCLIQVLKPFYRK